MKGTPKLHLYHTNAGLSAMPTPCVDVATLPQILRACTLASIIQPFERRPVGRSYLAVGLASLVRSVARRRKRSANTSCLHACFYYSTNTPKAQLFWGRARIFAPIAPKERKRGNSPHSFWINRLLFTSGLIYNTVNCIKGSIPICGCNKNCLASPKCS